MSKIKNLKNEKPEYVIDLIEMFRNLDPSETGKYVPFIMKQFEKKIAEIIIDFIESEEYKESKKYGVEPKNTIDMYFNHLLWIILGSENMYALKEFEKHLNEKRINDPDIQNYKDWNDIYNGVFSANIKLKEKELKKQTKVLYDKNGWLVLKPLSFAASLAYGAGTKWCTASKNNPSYFYDYCSRGSLVYIINRQTNYKAAMYMNLYSKPLATNQKPTDISFWNAEDHSVDSFMLNLPSDVMNALRDLINDRTQCKPNKYFFSKSELKNLNEKDDKATAGGILLPMPDPVNVYREDITIERNLREHIIEDILGNEEPQDQTLDDEECDNIYEVGLKMEINENLGGMNIRDVMDDLDEPEIAEIR